MNSFNDRETSDFRIVGSDEEIYLHRHMISNIPYFKSYLSNFGNDKDYIATDSIDAVKIILEAWYGGEFRFDENYWKDVVDFAIMWQLPKRGNNIDRIIDNTSRHSDQIIANCQDLEFYYIRIIELCKYHRLSDLPLDELVQKLKDKIPVCYEDINLKCVGKMYSRMELCIKFNAFDKIDNLSIGMSMTFSHYMNKYYNHETGLYTPKQVSILCNRKISVVKERDVPTEETNSIIFYLHRNLGSGYFSLFKLHIEKLFFVKTFLPLRGTLMYPVAILNKYNIHTGEFNAKVYKSCELADNFLLHLRWEDRKCYTPPKPIEIKLINNCTVTRIKWCCTEMNKMLSSNLYTITVDTELSIDPTIDYVLYVLKYII